MHAPLIAEGRLLGVLAVRTRRAGPCDERERAVLGTLSVFGAIALARAATALSTPTPEPFLPAPDAAVVVAS